MTSQIQRRWGILALAVLMFFVTLIVTQINGAKTSIYYYVWIMVGYYAYKARLSDIQTMMKYFIYLNVAVLGLVVSFMDSDSLSYAAKGGKSDLIIGVLIMLVPKVILFFYCKKQLKKSVGDSDSSIWEQVSTEMAKGKRVDSLWVRAFSESDGEINKANARYIKLRVNQIKSEVGVADRASSFSKSHDSENKIRTHLSDFWGSFNTVGRLALIGILALIGLAVYTDYYDSSGGGKPPSSVVGSTNNPAAIESSKPTYADLGWTQKSTGSGIVDPFSSKATRYCRYSDGVIQNLYPRGVMPNAEKANPFCLGDSMPYIK
jgi:hypothetical protein